MASDLKSDLVMTAFQRCLTVHLMGNPAVHSCHYVQITVIEMFEAQTTRPPPLACRPQCVATSPFDIDHARRCQQQLIRRLLGQRTWPNLVFVFVGVIFQKANLEF